MDILVRVEKCLSCKRNINVHSQQPTPWKLLQVFFYSDRASGNLHTKGTFALPVLKMSCVFDEQYRPNEKPGMNTGAREV
jgi:hypothetical protein